MSRLSSVYARLLSPARPGAFPVSTSRPGWRRLFGAPARPETSRAACSIRELHVERTTSTDALDHHPRLSGGLPHGGRGRLRRRGRSGALQGVEGDDGLVDGSAAAASPRAETTMASPASLQKLLRLHTTMKRNDATLHHDEQACASFCALCAEALEDSGILEETARAGAGRPAPAGPSRNALVHLHIHRTVRPPGETDALPRVWDLSLPQAAVDWLQTPLVVPPDPDGGRSPAPAAPSAPRPPSAFPIEVLHRCFGVAGADPAPHVFLSEAVQLLETVAYFKWVKDVYHLDPPEATAESAFVQGRRRLRETMQTFPESPHDAASHARWAETVTREAAALMETIPKVDRLGTAPGGLYVGHVLDLLLGLLLRYALARGDALADPDRGRLFRLAMHPWCATDVAIPMARWYVRAVWSATRTTPPTADLALGGVQDLRGLCWPTIRDARSKLVRRAVYPDSTAGTGTPAATVEDRLARLRELLAVLHGEEAKQWVAGELLWDVFQRPMPAPATLRLLLYALDVDRFLSERRAPPTAGVAWVPYALSRHILTTQAGPLAAAWPEGGSKRVRLIGDAVAHAVEGPCRDALSGTAEATSRTPSWRALGGLLEALRRHPALKERLQDLWLAEMESLPSPEPAWRAPSPGASASVVPRLLQRGYVAVFLLWCEVETTAETVGSSASSSSSRERTFAASVGQAYARAVEASLADMASWAGEEAERAAMEAQWPRVEDLDHHATTTKETNGTNETTSSPSLVRLRQCAAQVFTEALRRRLGPHAAGGSGADRAVLEEPILRPWCAAVRQAERDGSPPALSFTVLYTSLWELLSARGATEEAAEEAEEAEVTPPPVVLSTEEVVLLLRVLSARQARGGLLTTQTSAASCLETMAYTVVTESASTSSDEAAASTRAVVQRRTRQMERCLAHHLHSLHATLPLETMVQAVYTGLASVAEVAAWGLAPRPAAAEAAWRTSFAQTAAAESTTRLVAGAVVMRHVGLLTRVNVQGNLLPETSPAAVWLRGILAVLVETERAALRTEPASQETAAWTAPPSPPPPPPTMESARHVVGVCVLAASLLVSDGGIAPAPSSLSAASPGASLPATPGVESLYALLLHRVDGALAHLDRGYAEEVFLWLVTATHLVAARGRWSRGTATDEAWQRLTRWRWHPPATAVAARPARDVRDCLEASAWSSPEAIASAASLAQTWCIYLLTQLLPLIQRDSLSPHHRVPPLRQLTFVMVGVEGLRRLGAPLTWDGFPGAPLLLRAAEERRLVHRHLPLFLAAGACSPHAGAALLPVAHYLREARDLLSLAEVERALMVLHLAGGEARPRPETRLDGPGRVSEGAGRGPRRWGAFSSGRGSPLAVRQAWSSLTRRVLEYDLDTAPASTFVAVLYCGAAVGCTDTKLFERALAYLLVHQTEKPMDAAGWGLLLLACGTSFEQREAFAEVLQEPFLAFIASPQFALPSTEAPREVWLRETCAALGLLLEAASNVFLETDDFWTAVRAAVAQWSTETQGILDKEEASGWASEWAWSYNWSVRTAGHGHLVMPTSPLPRM